MDKFKENKLDYGVLLNIAPDHIDYHGSFDEYKYAKERIVFERTIGENQSIQTHHHYDHVGGNVDLNNLPFRFEMITESIINDSKSTNMHSLDYAIDKANIYFKCSKYHLIICGNPVKEGFNNFHPEGPDLFYFLMK